MAYVSGFIPNNYVFNYHNGGPVNNSNQIQAQNVEVGAGEPPAFQPSVQDPHMAQIDQLRRYATSQGGGGVHSAAGSAKKPRPSVTHNHAPR